MRAAREGWHGLLADVRLGQLVFLDEFGATTNMTRRYARGPVGLEQLCSFKYLIRGNGQTRP